MVVIEVSKSQGRVNITDFRDTMRINRYKALMGKDNDWVIVDTAATDSDAVQKASFWRGVLRNQEGKQ